MKKDRLIQEIETLVKPISDELEYELYYVEFVKENGENYLRIYIDKDGGVALSDCEALSRRVSDTLDEVDPITESYYLEVSSPGLNRGLYKPEHFERFLEREVFIRFTGSLEGRKNIKGILKEASDDYIVVEGEATMKILKEKIKSANIDGEI
ncbi:MAG: ribosome maturation factor RimP [Clostridium sp.]